MGIHESLCETDITNEWCNFEATDNISIIVETIFFVFLILLIFVLIYYYRTLIEYRNDEQIKHLFGDIFKRIYFFVTLWLVFSLIKVIINLAVYFQYMKEDFQLQVPTLSNFMLDIQNKVQLQADSPIVVCSIMFLMFDFLCAFILFYLISVIPYHWLKTSLYNINENNKLSYQIRKRIHTYFKLIRAASFYCKYIRNLFIVVVLIQPFLFFFTDLKCQIPTISSYLVMYVVFQSVLITIFYSITYFISNFMRKNELVLFANEDIKKLRNQYLLLISVPLIRVSFNIIFKLTDYYQYSPNQNCTDKQNILTSTINLTVGLFIMHLMPIVVILYIYRPNIRQRKRIQGILKFIKSRIGRSRQSVSDDNLDQSLIFTRATSSNKKEQEEKDKQINRSKERFSILSSHDNDNSNY